MPKEISNGEASETRAAVGHPHVRDRDDDCPLVRESDFFGLSVRAVISSRAGPRCPVCAKYSNKEKIDKICIEIVEEIINRKGN